MGRSPNDDRSDSMNPNNDAFHASQANRERQLGCDDGEDYICNHQPQMLRCENAGLIPTVIKYNSGWIKRPSCEEMSVHQLFEELKKMGITLPAKNNKANDK